MQDKIPDTGAREVPVGSLANFIASLLAQCPYSDRAAVLRMAAQRVRAMRDSAAPELWAGYPDQADELSVRTAQQLTLGLSHLLAALQVADPKYSVADLMLEAAQGVVPVAGDPSRKSYDCAVHVLPLGGDLATVLGNIGKGLFTAITGEQFMTDAEKENLRRAEESTVVAPEPIAEPAPSGALTKLLTGESDAVVKQLEELQREVEASRDNNAKQARQLAKMNWAAAVLQAPDSVADVLSDVPPSLQNLTSFYGTLNSAVGEAVDSDVPERAAAYAQAVKNQAKSSGLSWNSIKKMLGIDA